MSKRTIELTDALKAVDEWLNSDETWVTDSDGNKIEGGLIAAKTGSMLSRFIGKMPKKIDCKIQKQAALEHASNVIPKGDPNTSMFISRSGISRMVVTAFELGAEYYQHKTSIKKVRKRSSQTINSLLLRSLGLLEEMIDNHDADCVTLTQSHYLEVKNLIKDIRYSKR